MGLDMYLTGKKYLLKDYKNKKNNKKEDGYELVEKSLRLGYWRKHPDLHGYIVNNYADGNDNCEEIELSIENLKEILSAIKEDKLTTVTGFFFGESQPEDKEESIVIIEGAIKWREIEQVNVIKSVVYRASW